MMGLGWGEIAVIVLIALALAGPAAVPKLIETFKSVQKAKSQLTGKAAIQNLLLGDDERPRDDRPRDE